MKHAPRFAIASSSISGGIAKIDGPELHHMREVSRVRTGAPVSLIDERGAEYEGVVSRFEPNHAIVEISERRAPRQERPVSLAAAIIKGPRMDLLVEKAAELGAAELWPILCARGVVRSPGVERIARWRRLATAAAKQSLAPHPMTVHEPLAFADLLRAVPDDTLSIICAIGAEPMGALIRKMRPHRILLACGPEGDFDRGEFDAATRAGFAPAGLGPNRLRSETAAIAAIGVAQAALSELDGGS